MKTTRKYKTEKDRPAAVKQAVKDCQEYCAGFNSNNTWIKLMQFLNTCSTQEQVDFGCSFIGIEGFPCTALFETYVQPRLDKVDPDFMDGQFNVDGH